LTRTSCLYDWYSNTYLRGIRLPHKGEFSRQQWTENYPAANIQPFSSDVFAWPRISTNESPCNRLLISYLQDSRLLSILTSVCPRTWFPRLKWQHPCFRLLFYSQTTSLFFRH
jgi:hypothetical protein